MRWRHLVVVSLDPEYPEGRLHGSPVIVIVRVNGRHIENIQRPVSWFHCMSAGIFKCYRGTCAVVNVTKDSALHIEEVSNIVQHCLINANPYNKKRIQSENMEQRIHTYVGTCIYKLRYIIYKTTVHDKVSTKTPNCKLTCKVYLVIQSK